MKQILKIIAPSFFLALTIVVPQISHASAPSDDSSESDNAQSMWSNLPPLMTGAYIKEAMDTPLSRFTAQKRKKDVALESEVFQSVTDDKRVKIEETTEETLAYNPVLFQPHTPEEIVKLKDLKTGQPGIWLMNGIPADILKYILNKLTYKERAGFSQTCWSALDFERKMDFPLNLGIYFEKRPLDLPSLVTLLREYSDHVVSVRGYLPDSFCYSSNMAGLKGSLMAAGIFELLIKCNKIHTIIDCNVELMLELAKINTLRRVSYPTWSFDETPEKRDLLIQSLAKQEKLHILQLPFSDYNKEINIFKNSGLLSGISSFAVWEQKMIKYFHGDTSLKEVLIISKEHHFTMNDLINCNSLESIIFFQDTEEDHTVQELMDVHFSGYPEKCDAANKIKQVRIVLSYMEIGVCECENKVHNEDDVCPTFLTNYKLSVTKIFPNANVLVTLFSDYFYNCRRFQSFQVRY